MKSNSLQSIWKYHRNFNPPEVVNDYIIERLLEKHDMDYLMQHAHSLECCFRRLEREWQRLHKYDYAWASKLSKETGKPVCVWLNKECMEATI